MKKLSKKVIENILNDDKFKDESIKLLNDLIDDEISKDDDKIDFDLIDECSKAIILISENKEYTKTDFIKLLNKATMKNKIIKISKKGFSATFKVALIAAILLTSAISVSAAVGNGTLNIQPETTKKVVIITEQESTTEKAKKEEVKTSNTTSKVSTSMEKTDSSVLVSKSISNIPSNKDYLLNGYCDQSAKVIDTYNYKKQGDTNYYITDEKINKVTKTHSQSESDYDIEKYKSKVDKQIKEEPQECDKGGYCTFGSWKVIKQPTCCEEGEQIRECSKCHTYYSCRIDTVNTHHFVENSVQKAKQDGNNFIDGKISYKCSNGCGSHYTKVIPCPKYVVLDSYDCYYDGKKHTPNVIAVLDRQKNEIPKNYYQVTVSGNDSPNCIDYGKCQIDITMNNKYYNCQMLVYYTILPNAPEFIGIASKDGSIMPYWNGNLCQNADIKDMEYTVQYSTTSDFSDNVTTKKSNGVTSQAIPSLEKGKTYYVRIKAYDKLTSGSSVWSDVRKVTVK